ncbi:hypothetical protein GCM10007159_02880 [Modicisalibacter luteus]|nr:hypothetical protein GCM10007159_02880 [Halomonas lutea]
MKHYTAREMVGDLIAFGLTQQQIAKRIRVSQATIARVHKGADTRYESGTRLAAIHRQACPEKYVSQHDSHPKRNESEQNVT